MLNDVLGNFAIRIVKVSKHPHSCHAGSHAGGFFTFLDKFDTKSALFNVPFLFDDPDIIRAGCDAILTTDAFILIDQNHSILSFM
jgi:hypothetical protein